MAETPEKYDAIVIGAGQGGKPLSMELATSGRRTALVESKYVGGTCVNVGCTPTKTMVASARVAYLARLTSDGQGLLNPRELAEQVYDLALLRELISVVFSGMTAPIRRPRR